MKAAVWITLALVAHVPIVTHGQNDPGDGEHRNDDSPNRTAIGGKWYLNFRVGEEGNEDVSRFHADRGYIIVEHQLTDRLSGRITPDISMDREGDGEGDLEVRLKYCFLDYALDDLWFFTDPHVEFGLVHRPWLDFEEHINYYRVQGTMFLERNGIFNSGDYGFTLFSSLGGVMDDDYRASVNDKYPGRYGSFAVGLYNGGGYHGIERNTNKTIEGRLTVRPLPNVVPGLQFSYHGVYGAGNDLDATDWTVNLLFVSWENEHVVLTAQRYWGVGDFKSHSLDDDGNAVNQDGVSLFGELRLPVQRLSLLGRFDSFDAAPSVDGGEGERVIAGVAYHLKGHSKILLDYDVEDRGGTAGMFQKLLKLSVEFSF